jgi:putative hydroxymethylpyrimidine transport system permease protein
MITIRRILLPVLLLVALLGIWELYVDLGGADPLVLPPPHQIASALFHDRAPLWSNFLVTAKEVVLGIAVAVAAGFVLSVTIHFSPALRRAVYPLVVASQAVPVVVVAPLFLFWLGFGIVPKLLVIGLVAFFPVVVTTSAALETIDPDLIKLMRTFDASRREIFRRVELPAALPGLFTGAKLAAVFSVIGAVFAEQAGANAGLGYLFTITQSQLEIPEAYAAVAVLSGFAILLFVLLSVAERRALPWAYQRKGESNR